MLISCDFRRSCKPLLFGGIVTASPANSQYGRRRGFLCRLPLSTSRRSPRVRVAYALSKRFTVPNRQVTTEAKLVMHAVAECS